MSGTARTTSVWEWIRWTWIRVGALAGIVFVTWGLLAYRATSEAHAALESDARVEVTDRSDHWLFAPRTAAADVGLIFYAGALVDPIAYAPLAQAVAERGYPVLLVRLPFRGAFGGADGAAPLTRAIDATLGVPEVKRWVVGGHSRGGKVAAQLVRTGAPSLAGLILIGTSHPRDFSLAGSRIPVTRVFGTRDTVADIEKVLDVRRNLPPGTRDVRIDGGNHSQFGYYGFQPGDWRATITREAQQRLTLEAIVSALAAVSTEGTRRTPRPHRPGSAFRSRENWHPRGAVVGGLGFASGFFGGIAGNQGGLRAAALTAFSLSPLAFVATSTATGLLVDAARVPIYIYTAGPALLSLWIPIAAATVGVIAGTLLGERILLGMPRERFARLVAIAVGALGLWLLLS